MTAAIVAMALVAAGALALWIRALMKRGDQVPELRAAIKTVTDERNEARRELALERDVAATLRTANTKLQHDLAAASAVRKKETDARIEKHPDDAGAQRDVADELLERPWPGDRPAGA